MRFLFISAYFGGHTILHQNHYICIIPNKNKKEYDSVNESKAQYPAEQHLSNIYKTVTISSMEEMEKDNYRHWLSLSPEQRLAEHLQLLSQIYKDKVEKANGILFDKIHFH